MTELETLMQSIAALEAQRAILGDAVIMLGYGVGWACRRGLA